MKQFFSILIFSFKRSLRPMVIILLCNITLIWIYCAIWPSMETQTDALNAMITSMPAEFLKAFNIEGTMNNGLESLLVTKHFSLLVPIFIVILSNILAGNAIADSIDKRTILLTMGQPVSRGVSYFSLYLSGLFAMFLNAVTIATALPFARLYNITLNSDHIINFVFQTLLLGVAMYSFSFMISAQSSDRGRVSGLTTGVFVVSYVIKLVAELTDSLSFLKYTSVLYYYGPFPDTSFESVLTLFAVALICVYVGLKLFIRRDIQVR